MRWRTQQCGWRGGQWRGRGGRFPPNHINFGCASMISGGKQKRPFVVRPSSDLLANLDIRQSMSTMVMLSRRALLLSALLCGVVCSSSAFTVRPGADVSQLLSSERHHQQKCPGRLTNRSSPEVFVAGKGIALSVASGGAAAASEDGPSSLEKLKAFTSKNFFLLGMMVAVALARAFPHVSRLLLSIISHITHHRTASLLSHTSILSHNISSTPNMIQSITCNSLEKMEEFCVPNCSSESMVLRASFYFQVFRWSYQSCRNRFVMSS